MRSSSPLTRYRTLTHSALEKHFYDRLDQVVAHGQPIGMIVAQTKILAQKAARAVKVEYEDLPRIMTIEEAVEQQSFHPTYDRWIKRGGPIQEALAASDHVLEGKTRMGGQVRTIFNVYTYTNFLDPGTFLS